MTYFTRRVDSRYAGDAAGLKARLSRLRAEGEVEQRVLLVGMGMVGRVEVLRRARGEEGPCGRA